MDTNNSSPDNERAEKQGKKTWAKLEIKVLEVPKGTLGGTSRLDPVEDFFMYRTS